MEERLLQILEHYNIKVSQFEQKIFVSNGTIRNAIRRKGGLNSVVLAKILDIYPDISPDWLLLGKGEMLRKNVQNAPQVDTLDMVSLEKYEKKVEECALLKAELAAMKEYAASYAKEKTASSGITSPADV